MPGEMSRINGASGGRPIGSKAAHTLQAQEAKAVLVRAYCENAQPINEALISKAKQGDIRAIRELHERVYGRATQELSVNTDAVCHIIKIDE